MLFKTTRAIHTLVQISRSLKNINQFVEISRNFQTFQETKTSDILAFILSNTTNLIRYPSSFSCQLMKRNLHGRLFGFELKASDRQILAVT